MKTKSLFLLIALPCWAGVQHMGWAQSLPQEKPVLGKEQKDLGEVSQNEPQKQKTKAWLMGFQAGAASALGYGGFSMAYLHKKFELEFGMGYGYSGIQLSIMPKISTGSEKHRFLAGIGIAMGVPVSHDWTASLWLNADLVGYEYRHPNGFTFFIGGGAFVGLAGRYDDDVCLPFCGQWTETSNGLPVLKGSSDTFPVAGEAGPQIRMGFGYRF